MKRSNTWFALILIASALLLSGESPSTQPSPKPITKPNETSGLIEQPAANHPTPSATTNPPKSPNETARTNENGSNDSGDSSSSVMIFLTFVMAAATVALAVFNFQLVGVTQDLHKVATRDVLSDRPFVIAAAVDAERDGHGLRPKAVFRNCGNSPAVITRIAFGFQKHPYLLTGREPLITRTPAPKYEELPSAPLTKHVLATADEITVSHGIFLLSEPEWATIFNGESRIAVFGKVYYRDAATESYEQPFYWFYSPPGLARREAFFYLGPDELNRGT